MDYEKKYNEAFEKARRLYEGKDKAPEEPILEYLFPELRESEDERIRQYLIEWVSISDNPRKKECLSWLEKQKEQKPIGTDFCTAVKNLMNLHKIKNEFTEEDYDFQAKELLKLIKQKPAEWSEEDERYINGLIGLIEDMKVGISPKLRGVTADRCIAFIKSLRPQQKYEWNEADENALIQLIENGVTKAICKTGFKFHFDDEYAKELIEYIRAFNPAPHWKPSEVQMDALKELIDDANKAGWVTPGATELYEQLKKL